ncbi:MAG: PTS sugar transporter subunit IIA, partial [Planctomycetes bacterium]|nr:PTS sugar transporter subunit IIA [Planctomycetota bacterium]
ITMKLSDLLTEKQIVLNLSVRDKWEAIKLLSRAASSNCNISKTQLRECIESLNSRERISSTYVGNGVAIPHATVSSISNVLIALGIASSGLMFDSNNYATIIALFIVPSSTVKTHAITLSQIALLLSKEETRNKLLVCDRASEVIEIIKQEESK